MSDKCKNPSCGKELVHTEGRRKKEFCSKECRNKVNTALFQSRHKGDKKPKMKCIPIEEFNEYEVIKEINKKLLKQVEEQKLRFEEAVSKALNDKSTA